MTDEPREPEPPDLRFCQEDYDAKHGDGAWDELPDCQRCEGHGWLDDPDDGGTMSCPDCDDTGKQEPEDW